MTPHSQVVIVGRPKDGFASLAYDPAIPLRVPLDART
jgi:hypothetical protein